MNQKTVREFAKRLQGALEHGGFISDRKAEMGEITALSGKLAELLDFPERVSCNAVEKACAEYIGEAPENGWCRFCYDYLRALNFPRNDPPSDLRQWEHGAQKFLTILQVLLDTERLVFPFDSAYDFQFLPPLFSLHFQYH